MRLGLELDLGLVGSDLGLVGSRVRVIVGSRVDLDDVTQILLADLKNSSYYSVIGPRFRMAVGGGGGGVPRNAITCIYMVEPERNNSVLLINTELSGPNYQAPKCRDRTA